jgi:hypothetical protein
MLDSDAFTIEGHMFEKVNDNHGKSIYYNLDCKTNITLKWNYVTNQITEFRGSLNNKDCSLPLSMSINNMVVDYSSEENYKRIFYSLFVSILIAMQVYSTLLLNKKTFENFTNSNSVNFY